MYPYEILPGIDLYLIFLCVAVLSALVVFRFMADKLKIAAKLQNFCLYTGIGAIVFGYFSAVLFQAFYNIKREGQFIINSSTGATFYGGLIGGAAFFLIIYFTVGQRIFKGKEHLAGFFSVADAAACSIAVAHAFGRIGCLMAGCCYGKPTNSWLGVYMPDLGCKVVPLQLFEALFLAFLFVYMFQRIKDKQTYCLQIYLCAYGVWRFVIEFVRNDYRGATIIETVTPSQLTAIIMVILGVMLLLVQRNLQFVGAGANDEESESEEYEYDDDADDYEYAEDEAVKAEDTKEEQE